MAQARVEYEAARRTLERELYEKERMALDEMENVRARAEAGIAAAAAQAADAEARAARAMQQAAEAVPPPPPQSEAAAASGRQAAWQLQMENAPQAEEGTVAEAPFTFTAATNSAASTPHRRKSGSPRKLAAAGAAPAAQRSPAAADPALSAHLQQALLDGAAASAPLAGRGTGPQAAATGPSVEGQEEVYPEVRALTQRAVWNVLKAQERQQSERDAGAAPAAAAPREQPEAAAAWAVQSPAAATPLQLALSPVAAEVLDAMRRMVAGAGSSSPAAMLGGMGPGASSATAGATPFSAGGAVASFTPGSSGSSGSSLVPSPSSSMAQEVVLALRRVLLGASPGGEGSGSPGPSTMSALSELALTPPPSTGGSSYSASSAASLLALPQAGSRARQDELLRTTQASRPTAAPPSAAALPSAAAPALPQPAFELEAAVQPAVAPEHQTQRATMRPPAPASLLAVDLPPLPVPILTPTTTAAPAAAASPAAAGTATASNQDFIRMVQQRLSSSPSPPATAPSLEEPSASAGAAPTGSGGAPSWSARTGMRSVTLQMAADTAELIRKARQRLLDGGSAAGSPAAGAYSFSPSAAASGSPGGLDAASPLVKKAAKRTADDSPAISTLQSAAAEAAASAMPSTSAEKARSTDSTGSVISFSRPAPPETSGEATTGPLDAPQRSAPPSGHPTLTFPSLASPPPQAAAAATALGTPLLAASATAGSAATLASLPGRSSLPSPYTQLPSATRTLLDELASFSPPVGDQFVHLYTALGVLPSRSPSSSPAGSPLPTPPRSPARQLGGTATRSPARSPLRPATAVSPPRSLLRPDATASPAGRRPSLPPSPLHSPGASALRGAVPTGAAAGSLSAAGSPARSPVPSTVRLSPQPPSSVYGTPLSAYYSATGGSSFRTTPAPAGGARASLLQTPYLSPAPVRNIDIYTARQPAAPGGHSPG